MRSGWGGVLTGRTPIFFCGASFRAAAFALALLAPGSPARADPAPDPAAFAAIPGLETSFFWGRIEKSYRGVDALGSGRWSLRVPINNARARFPLRLRLEEVIELDLAAWFTLDRDAGTLQARHSSGIRRRSNAGLDAWALEGAATGWVARTDEWAFGLKLSAFYDTLDFSGRNPRQIAVDPAQTFRADGKLYSFRQERASFPFGVAVRWRPAPLWTVDWSCSGSAFASFWERERDRLRSMRSHTEGTALFGISTLGIDFEPLDSLHIGLFGEATILSSWWERRKETVSDGSRRRRYDHFDGATKRWSCAAGIRAAWEF